MQEALADLGRMARGMPESCITLYEGGSTATITPEGDGDVLRFCQSVSSSLESLLRAFREGAPQQDTTTLAWVVFWCGVFSASECPWTSSLSVTLCSRILETLGPSVPRVVSSALETQELGVLLSSRLGGGRWRNDRQAAHGFCSLFMMVDSREGFSRCVGSLGQTCVAMGCSLATDASSPVARVTGCRALRHCTEVIPLPFLEVDMALVGKSCEEAMRIRSDPRALATQLECCLGWCATFLRSAAINVDTENDEDCPPVRFVLDVFSEWLEMLRYQRPKEAVLALPGLLEVMTQERPGCWALVRRLVSELGFLVPVISGVTLGSSSSGSVMTDDELQSTAACCLAVKVLAKSCWPRVSAWSAVLCHGIAQACSKRQDHLSRSSTDTGNDSRAVEHLLGALRAILECTGPADPSRAQVELVLRSLLPQ